jgi:hypothetical protein
LTGIETHLDTITDHSSDLWQLSDTALHATLVLIDAIANRVEATRLMLIRASTARDGGTTHTTRTILTDQCRRSTATTDLANAAITDPDTGTLKRLGHSMAAGHLSTAHLHVARKATAQIPPDVLNNHADTLDTLLTDYAHAWSATGLSTITDHLLDTLDPHGRDRIDETTYTHRSLTLHDDTSGMTTIKGYLDTGSALTLRTVLDHLARPDHPTTNPAHPHTHTDTSHNPDTSHNAGHTIPDDSHNSSTRTATNTLNTDTRTPTQRRADALTTMAHLAAEQLALITNHPTTTTRPARAIPHIAITIHPTTDHPDHNPTDTDTATDTTPDPPTRTPPTTDHSPPHHTPPDHRYALGPTNRPVPTTLLHELLCDAAYDTITTTRTGRIIALHTTGRLATPTQLAAITARDRGCTFPNCTAPPAMCHAHHVTYHRHGGPTHTDNLTLLCWRHHHQIHQTRNTTTGWTMQMINAIPHAIPPTRIDPTQTPIRNTLQHAITHAINAATLISHPVRR